MMGGLFEVIEARGEMDSTVIALASDHGEMNGDYGLIYKGNFLESAVRIPFLIRTPAGAAEWEGSGGPAKICESPIEWFDLGPTLVELAAAKIGHRQFAKSLIPCLRDAHTPVRDESLCELAGEIMIRNAQWKLAANVEGKPYLLFDLGNDPLETRNLAGLSEYREVEAHLLLKMRERVSAA
jgi:choline-sulfatase